MTQTLTADQHRAMEGVAPFELPDEAVISGRKVAGTVARVYWLLRLTAERNIQHRIGEQMGPAGWVPNYYLRRAWSGGSAGDRRMRDLRLKFGVELNSCRFSGDSRVELFAWVSDGAPEGTADRAPEASSSQRTETRPLARRSQMGGFRLRFWVSVGFPGENAPGRLQLLDAPEHPLAFSSRVLEHVVRGDLDRAAALDGYSATLKGRWPQLRAWLAAGGEHVLWVAPEVAETINPLPLLTEILTKCGAEFMGDWNQDRQAGVA